MVVDNGGGGPRSTRPAGARACASSTRAGTSGSPAAATWARGRRDGDVLLFLNPDTVAAPGRRRRARRTLEDPAIGIAMARLRLLDRPELLNSCGSEVHISGISWAGGYGGAGGVVTELRDVACAERRGDGDPGRDRSASSAASRTSSSCTRRTSCSAGRRGSRGLRVVVDPRADVYHDYEYGRNVAKHYLLERNRLVFVLSAYSPRLLALLGPVLLAAELAMAALAAREGWLREKLARLGLAAPRNARWLARRAARTQRLRRVSGPRARAAADADDLPGHDRPARTGSGGERPGRGVLVGWCGARCDRALGRPREPRRRGVPPGRAARAGRAHGGRRRRVHRRRLRLERRQLAGRRAALGPGARASLRGEHRLRRRLQPRRAEAARGRLVAFVNFDGEVEPGWDTPLRALLDDPGVSVASGLLLDVSGETIEAAGLEIAPNMATFGRGEGLARAQAPEAPFDVTAASGALTMVRREDFLAVGRLLRADLDVRRGGRLRSARTGPRRHPPGERDPPPPRRGRRGAAVAHAAVLRLAKPPRERGAAPAGRRAGEGGRVLGRLRRRSRSPRCAAATRPAPCSRAGATVCALLRAERRARTRDERRQAASRLTSLRDSLAQQRRLGRL